MTKKTLCILLFLTVQVFAASAEYDLWQEREKWYRNMEPLEREEMEALDDELLGRDTAYVSLKGRVFDYDTGEAISDALIYMFDLRGKLKHKTVSDNDGRYALPKSAVRLGALYVKVVAMGHLSVTKAFNSFNAANAFDVRLPRSSLNKIENSGRTKVISDDGNVMLSVPPEILHRPSGGAVRFPVYLRLRYINPETDLELMPGIGMLADYRGLGVVPLKSVGAVLIEAYDSEGQDVRVSRALEAVKGESTYLRIRTPGSISNETFSKVVAWSLTAGSGGVWTEMGTQIETNDTEVAEAVGYVVGNQYLTRYGEDVAKRIKKVFDARKENIAELNTGGKTLYSDNIRFTQEPVRPDKIILSLFDFILQDIEPFLSEKEKEKLNECIGDREWIGMDFDASAKKNGVSGAQTGAQAIYYVDGFWHMFEVRIDGKWYNAYEVMKATGGPQFSVSEAKPSKDFFYDPLKPLISKLCRLLEEVRWKNAVTVKSVDFVPFNLDVPKKAVAVRIRLRESFGDGIFKATLKTEYDSEGGYQTTRYFDAKSEYAVFNALVPENSTLKFEIISEVGKKANIERTYKVRKSKKTYEWNENKTKIVDERGKDVDWSLLETIDF